jgi:hypothetical protein
MVFEGGDVCLGEMRSKKIPKMRQLLNCSLRQKFWWGPTSGLLNKFVSPRFASTVYNDI